MTEFKPIGSIPGYEELSHEDDTEPQEDVLAYRDQMVKELHGEFAGLTVKSSNGNL